MIIKKYTPCGYYQQAVILLKLLDPLSLRLSLFLNLVHASLIMKYLSKEIKLCCERSLNRSNSKKQIYVSILIVYVI